MAFVSQNRPSASIALNARFVEAFETVLKAMRQRKLFRETLKELSALSDRDLNDLGLNRSMIVDVARTAVYK